MQTNIFQKSILCLALLTIPPHNILGKNNHLYISILNKFVQKNDFNTILLDIASQINNNNDEKIDIETIKKFTESNEGKNLKNSFINALNPNQLKQLPVSAIGNFLYDFYQANIFGNQTTEIGKIFEIYLLTFHKITSPIHFDHTITAKDLIKKHRNLLSQETINNALVTLIKAISLIKNATLEQLTDADYLENNLLLEIGLNDVNLHEFPSHLNQYYGKGLKSWQYPNQFSKFLVSLSKLEIKTNLEIGVGYGGTFIIITEYLKRFNPNLKSYAIDPHYSIFMDIYANDINPDTTYILDYSTSKRFINLSDIQYDLSFIDGDHAFEAVTADYNLVKNNSNILVLHDIFNDACPGVVSLWNILKKVYYKKNKIDEFTEQYEEVTKRQNKKYLGIGVIYKNILK